jgi:hypothetical protein
MQFSYPTGHPHYSFAQERLHAAEKAMSEGHYQAFVMNMRNLRAAGFYDVRPENQIQLSMLNICKLPIDLYANELVKIWRRRPIASDGELGKPVRAYGDGFRASTLLKRMFFGARA